MNPSLVSNGETGGDGSPGKKRSMLSRRRILDAARDVFFRDGFMLANLDEVATRAGVAKGTLYRYFESKADLYVAVLADNGQVFVQKMNEVAEAERPVRDAPASVGELLSRPLGRAHRLLPDLLGDRQPVPDRRPARRCPEGGVEPLGDSLSILKSVLDRGVASRRTLALRHLGGFLHHVDDGERPDSVRTHSPRKELRRRPLREVYRDAIDLIVLGLSRKDGEAS